MYAYSVTNKRLIFVAVAALVVVMNGQRAQAQLSGAGSGPGWVLSHQKISDTQGDFTGILNDQDRFGFSVASLGDLDGDGVDDLAVGAYWDDDGGTDRGAVWVLFLDGALGKCPWDLDNSGSVGTSDLLELFAQWGTDGPADFDESGAVGTGDLLILFANWGPCK